MKQLAVLSIVFLLVSCTPKKAVQPVASADTHTAAEAAKGQIIFENSCDRCHALPDPKKYSDEQWVDLVKAMAPKAKLDAQQAQLVYDFVSTHN